MKKSVLLIAAALFGLMNAVAFAADTPTIARMWKVTPKPGMEQDLEDAIKAHSAYRMDNKDSWTWNVYQTLSGDMDGSCFIRSANHTWADIGAYSDSEFVENARNHWNANVDQYVQTYHGSMAEYLPEISNWPEGAVYEYYWVYTYHIQPGRTQAWEAAAKAIVDVLKEQGWDDTWAFTRHLTGDAAATSLVLPENDWGGFAGPENDAYQTVVAAKGEATANAMWAAYFADVNSVESVIYYRHEDLGVMAAGN